MLLLLLAAPSGLKCEEYISDASLRVDFWGILTLTKAQMATEV